MKKIRLLTLAVAILLLLTLTATAASPLNHMTQMVIKIMHEKASEMSDAMPEIFFLILPEEGELLYAALPSIPEVDESPSFLFANHDFGIRYFVESLDDAVILLEVTKGMFDDFTPKDITVYYYNGQTDTFI